MEGGLAREDILALNAADQSHPAPLGMAKVASSLEVATKEGPAPEGGAGGDLAPKGGAGGDLTPEGVGAGCSSAASMDIHVGSSLVQSEELMVTHLSAALASLVT